MVGVRVDSAPTATFAVDALLTAAVVYPLWVPVTVTLRGCPICATVGVNVDPVAPLIAVPPDIGHW